MVYFNSQIISKKFFCFLALTKCWEKSNCGILSTVILVDPEDRNDATSSRTSTPNEPLTVPIPFYHCQLCAIHPFLNERWPQLSSGSDIVEGSDAQFYWRSAIVPFWKTPCSMSYLNPIIWSSKRTILESQRQGKTSSRCCVKNTEKTKRKLQKKCTVISFGKFFLYIIVSPTIGMTPKMVTFSNFAKE